MKERLDHLLTHLNITSAQFADIIGVQRSSISHIISGRNKPSFDFIQKILLKYPEISADWLITGRGSINALNNNSISTSTVETKQDLFNQNLVNQDTNQIKDQAMPDKTNVNSNDKVDQTEKKPIQVTNVNNVKSIILIYQDDSFKILNSK